MSGELTGAADVIEGGEALTLEQVRRLRDADPGPIVARPVVSATEQRRRSVAALDAEGLCQAEIARRLEVSATTVRKDLRALGRTRR
jgi:DNA-binding NarL/FixJ family response regulator